MVPSRPLTRTAEFFDCILYTIIFSTPKSAPISLHDHLRYRRPSWQGHARDILAQHLQARMPAFSRYHALRNSPPSTFCLAFLLMSFLNCTTTDFSCCAFPGGAHFGCDKNFDQNKLANVWFLFIIKNKKCPVFIDTTTPLRRTSSGPL